MENKTIISQSNLSQQLKNSTPIDLDFKDEFTSELVRLFRLAGVTDNYFLGTIDSWDSLGNQQYLECLKNLTESDLKYVRDSSEKLNH